MKFNQNINQTKRRNIMRSKFFITLSTFLMMLFLSSSLIAQQGKQMRRHMGDGPHADGKGMMMQMLDLTEDQQAQMEKLRVEHMKQMLPSRNKVQEKEAQKRTLETSEKVDMKAVNKLIDEISDIKTEMAKNRAKHHQDVRNILSEEQRVKFDSMPKGRHGFGERGKGRHGQFCEDCPRR